MSVIRPVTESVRRFPVRRMLAISPFVVIALGAAVMGARVRVPQDQIAPGVRVGEMDLSGKSLAEARSALERWSVRQQSTPILLRCSSESGLSRQWKPDAQKIGLGIDIAGTLEAAGKAGRDNILSQVSQIVSSAKPISVAVRTSVDDSRLRTYLKRQVAVDSARTPKNARFVLLPGGAFGTHHEHTGLSLDIDRSAAAIKEAWTARYLPDASTASPSQETPQPDPTGQESPKPDAGSDTKPGGETTATPYPDVSAVLAFKIVQPDIKAADIEQIDGVLGAKSSYVNGTAARLGNIRIAAKHINGTLLKPGEVFSYNNVVGPRDEDEGYREAPILIEGRHEKGLAGGICQTSGTLFNAVLKSGLKIVQRDHHSTAIGYLPIGLDATVSYGSHDLKFQNDTGLPVYVAARLSGRELTFTLFGKKMPGREVSLVRSSFSRSPANGSTSVTWRRFIREDGQVVHRDTISSHYMKPQPSEEDQRAALLRARKLAAKKKARLAAKAHNAARAPSASAPAAPSAPAETPSPDPQ